MTISFRASTHFSFCLAVIFLNIQSASTHILSSMLLNRHSHHVSMHENKYLSSLSLSIALALSVDTTWTILDKQNTTKKKQTALSHDWTKSILIKLFATKIFGEEEHGGNDDKAKKKTMDREFIVFPANLFIWSHSVIDSNGKRENKELDYNKSNIFYSHPIKVNEVCVRHISIELDSESWEFGIKKSNRKRAQRKRIYTLVTKLTRPCVVVCV